MKTRILKTKMKNQMFGLAILSIIALLAFVFSPALGVCLAVAPIVASIDMTPEEEKLMNAISVKMAGELKKFEAGYISETKFNEMLTAQFKTFAQEHNVEQIAAFKDQIADLGIELKSMKEKGTGQVIYKSFKQQAIETLGDIKDMSIFKADIMSNKSAVSFSIDIDKMNFKTVGTVIRPTGASWIPPATYDMEWGVAPLNISKIRLVADVSTMSTSRLIWMEGGAREGAAGETGEASAKNQIDNTPVMVAMDAKKLTGYFNFSEEMLDDFPLWLAEMEKEIMGQINTKEDYQFINGAGTTIYLAGLTSYGKAYELTTVLTTAPNTYDCLIAMATQVRSHNFEPNAAILNPIDVANMRLVKASTAGSYMMLTPSGEIIPGFTVIESNNIAIGSAIVLDSTKYHIRDYKSLSVRFGYTGTNFVANIQTAIGEKRVAAYVKGGEEYAICYDTIADVKAAITGS